MAKKYITVQDYVNHFGMIVLSGYQDLKNRFIKEVPMNRPGFELTGFFDAAGTERLVIIGNKEMAYIRSKNEEDLMPAYDFLTNEATPAIVICSSIECPQALLDIAIKKNFPILSTSRSTSSLYVSTFTYLQEKLAPSTSLHASLVEIYSVGVLILGQSGIGKSETTLELIKRGHKLIADDRVNIAYVRDELIGESPELLSGMMEIRGIGVVDVKRIFGINSLIKKKKISYAINLIPFSPSDNYDRLGNDIKYYEILNHNLPLLNLPVSGARSMAELIEVAVTNLKLKEDGFDSTFEFENRMNELLKRKQNL